MPVLYSLIAGSFLLAILATPGCMQNTTASPANKPADDGFGSSPHGWRTYRSPQGCFRILYPSAVVPDTTDPSSVRFVTRHWTQPDSLWVEYVFMISVSPNPQGLTPEDWLRRMVAVDTTASEIDDTFHDRSPIRIGTLIGQRMRMIGFDEAIELVHLGANGLMYELSYPAGRADANEDIARYQPLFRRMLENFRPTSVAECKLARHSK